MSGRLNLCNVRRKATPEHGQFPAADGFIRGRGWHAEPVINCAEVRSIEFDWRDLEKVSYADVVFIRYGCANDRFGQAGS